MSDTNKKCYVCGKEYKYCNNCSDYTTQPMWKEMFDSENCKKIFDVICNYNVGIIDKKIIAKQLSECDLKDIKNYNKNIVNEINKLQNAFSSKVDIPTLKTNKPKQNSNKQTKEKQPE